MDFQSKIYLQSSKAIIFNSKENLENLKLYSNKDLSRVMEFTDISCYMVFLTFCIDCKQYSASFFNSVSNAGQPYLHNIGFKT